MKATVKVQEATFPIDTSAAVSVHLEGPNRGPIIGRIVHDTGPKTGDDRNCLKDFPWHARDGSGVVASSETYAGALSRLFERWVIGRIAMEARG